MNISVYGAGYVGLVSAVCLSKLGHQVICVDIDVQRIDMLLQGQCPIFEENLPILLQEQLATGRLHFTANLSQAVSAKVHIIATGTPSLSDGNADLSQVFSVAKKLAQEVKQDIFLIIKSTVPVGTGDAIQACVNQQLASYNKAIHIAVASNPEFLREGSAVYDFLHADRIILGGEDDALHILKSIYHPLAERGIPLVTMSRRSAELTKYSANAMLACRISFINQISQLAEELGADIDEIRQGIALDHRIGPHFLQAGIGYGGSCFPKDVRALIQSAKAVGIDTCLFDSVEKVNDEQKKWVFKQLNNFFRQDLIGLSMGFWGLSFKPGTDDLREASSLVAIESLLRAGVKLYIYDPVALTAAAKLFKKNDAINWCSSAEQVLEQPLNALVIGTEWAEFKNFPLTVLQQKLEKAPIIDGRNCYELEEIIAAQIPFYYSVGRPPVVNYKIQKF